MELLNFAVCVCVCTDSRILLGRGKKLVYKSRVLSIRDQSVPISRLCLHYKKKVENGENLFTG